jgi:hypothetical protein
VASEELRQEDLGSLAADLVVAEPVAVERVAAVVAEEVAVPVPAAAAVVVVAAGLGAVA